MKNGQRSRGKVEKKWKQKKKKKSRKGRPRGIRDL